jgi:hypothetical protein
MRWFIRLPRYGRPLAALNRNGIDIERRALSRGPGSVRITVASLLEFMLDAANLIIGPVRFPRLPLLIRGLRRPKLGEFPHIPRGNRVLPSEE